MVEEVIEATETDEVSWLDEHDFLSEDDRVTLSKYTTQEDALKGSANAIRQVGKSVRFPDDKTSDEDKVKFDERVSVYQGVPDNAEGYKLERPKELPEGMAWDEDLETWFREKVALAKLPNSKAQQIFNDYCERRIKQHNEYQEIVKGTEKELRTEIGDKKFEIWFGNPKDKESIGTIKQTVMQLSKDLELDYKGEDGSPQSHLADCLELQRDKGALGDKIPILKVLNLIHQIRYAEGESVTGDFASVKEKGKSVFDFDDMDEKENEGDAYGVG